MIQIDVTSEIGQLNAVMIHRPGAEIENMTPATAAEVLYDDIITLPLALEEHRQLAGVLNRVARVVEFQDLLADVLADSEIKTGLLNQLCQLYHCPENYEELAALDATPLARQLLEGTPMRKDTLEKYLNPLRHAIPPLPNAFFTRDATMCVHNRVIIGSMAYRVRVAESLLLRTIFRHHPQISMQGFYFDSTAQSDSQITIEGGDLLVLRDDLIVIGYSERTTAAGIDQLMQALAQDGRERHFVVVDIPKERATIHLDMIFTMVDRDKCVVFPPLMTGAKRCRAIHIRYDNRKVAQIDEHSDLLSALRQQGLELQPVHCGGNDPFQQEREQWSSGANFFAFAPGHIIGYRHNHHTMDALSQAGFEVVEADQIISGDHALQPDQPTLVVMDGAELSRGGGGCRCMTMPLSRQPVDW
ncbi:MAG: arginine deiminase family protein [Wenzhouxiangellaceae bacterium]